jgi:hypothetical protein
MVSPMSQTPNFRVFDAYGAASRPTATLRVSGYLFLSKGIQKRAGKERCTHAQLSFDEDAQKLGIRLFEDAAEDESIREVSQEKSGISVNILPLLRFYGFDKPPRKQVLSVEFDKNNDILVVDLSGLKPLPDEAYL